MLGEYLYPSDLFAVYWPGHRGLFLHNASGTEIYILDPHDSRDGQYRVVAKLPRGSVEYGDNRND